MGLTFVDSGAVISAEALFASALALIPMRQKKSRKSGKDDRANMVNRDSQRAKATNEPQNDNKPKGLSGSGGVNGTAKHRDNGRAQPRKKAKAFQYAKREKRNDETSTSAENTKIKQKNSEGSPESKTEGKASQDSVETIVDASLSPEASSERLPGRSLAENATKSPGSESSGDYPHPSYLRPDFLDLLNEHAKMCPPQPDPWGVRNEKFETIFRSLAPSERMSELGACIYVNALTNGLSELHGSQSNSEVSKKISWTLAVSESTQNNSNGTSANATLLRKGLPAPLTAYTHRTGAIGAERTAPLMNRSMPHPNEVESVVKSAKDLYKEQVGANDELAEIFFRRNRLSASNSTKNENIALNFKKTPGQNEAAHYQHFIPKLTSTSGISSVALNARANRDERVYATASQTAVMAASVAAAVAGGLPTSPQQQLAAAIQQYQYNPAHAPMRPGSAFDLRRMFTGRAETQTSGEGFPLYRR